MFGKLITFLLVLTSTSGWVLYVSHKHVTPTLTSNVTIGCHSNFNDQNTQKLIHVFLIQISKLKNKEWQTVASMTPRDVLVKTNLTYATATGSIDTTKNTYIQIHYNVADGQTHGQYVCHVAGLDQNMKPKSIKTEPVVITEDKVTYTDVLKMLGTLEQHEQDNKSEWEMMKYVFVQMYDDLQKVTSETNTMKVVISNISILDNDQSNNIDDLKMYISTVITNITTHQETINNDQSKKMDDLKMYMTNSIKDITLYQEIVNNNLNMYINNISTQQEIIQKNMDYNMTSLIKRLDPESPLFTWPTGKYSIPEPDTECPKTLTSTWKPSSLRISTAPNNNNDSHSSNLHLAGSVFEKINNNYITLKMCSMTGGGHGPEWPAGSYCVQPYSYQGNGERDCPSGFHFGYTRYGRFDDKSKDYYNNLPKSDKFNNNTYTYIIYCCRDDGSPINPIILPRLHPFYLYRYGGTCQEVVGMEVSNEWIHTDTGKWGVKDEYFYYDRSVKRGHKNNPDGSITNGVTTQICYYTPLD